MKSTKKLLTLLLAMLLIFATLVSCGDEVDESKGEYHVFGLYYTLGEGYNKINVPYSENCYTNGETYFFFQVYSGEGLEEIGVNANISVEIYMQKFLNWNYQDPFIYTYDKDRNLAYAHYLSNDMLVPEEAGESDAEYFYTAVLRGTSHLYIVNMSCAPELVDKYRTHFEDIIASLRAD